MFRFIFNRFSVLSLLSFSIVFSAVAQSKFDEDLQKIQPIQFSSEKVKYPENIDLSSIVILTIIERDKVFKHLNIDISKLYMQPIQLHCQSKNYTDFDDIYKCQIMAAIAEKEFFSNQKDCKIDSEYQFPLSLTKLNFSKIITKKEVLKSFLGSETEQEATKNYSKAFEIIYGSEKLSKKEIFILRDYYYSKCMRENGWRNPDAWQDGRKYQ